MQYDEGILDLAKKERYQNPTYSKVVFEHPQAGHVALNQLDEDSIEVVIELEFRFIFTRSEVKLLENLRDNLCMRL